MSNQPNDRARMRNDLRELAKLAAPSSSPAPASHRFDTADSSGYVDLSAFSATDSSWVDRELARAKGASAPPPLPGAPSKGKAIDRLSPESMAPVSLESFLAPDQTASTRAPRGRRVLYGLLAAASVAGVAALAVVVTRHAPPPEKAAAVAPTAAAPPAETAAAAATTAAPPPAATETSPTPGTGSNAAPAAPAPAPQASAETRAASGTPAGKKKAPAFHAHAAAAPAAAAPRAAAPPAAKPVVIPQAKTKSSGSSGDSLMDAIRSSVAKGK